VGHSGDPQRSHGNDDQQSGHRESGIHETRHENGEPLPGLIHNDQEDDDCGHREGRRLAPPAGI
jgi:hypothetical protein